MKAVRIWLLLVLAILVPVRGAVAAAMLCPVGSPTSHETMDHGMAHDHADRQHQHDHADAGHHEDGQGHGASDKCNACSACCSLTSLVSELHTLPEPIDLAAVKFPDLSSPAPTFLSDGQDRPPRSI